MAITEVTICNSALTKVGAERISTLSDSSKQARFANEQYAKLRDEVLIQHPWNFALKIESVAEDATAPDWGYTSRYAFPADCLRIYKLEDTTIEHKIYGRFIHTDQVSPLNFEYIAQITDTSLFTPIFAEALAARLAADLAYSLVNSAALQETMLKLYEYQLRLARTMDAQEGTPDSVEASSWLDSRY